MKGFGGIDGGGSRARMICMLLRWSLQQKTPYLADKVISEEAVDTDAVRAEDRHREGEPVQQVARRTKPTAKTHTPTNTTRVDKRQPTCRGTGSSAHGQGISDYGI